MDKNYIEARLKEVETRNIRVELDKAWEISFIRRISISVFTYASIALYFLAVGIERPFLNAVVPTFAFLLSTLSLPYIRKVWEKFKN